MKHKLLTGVTVAGLMLTAMPAFNVAAGAQQSPGFRSEDAKGIKRVLLISIDGMHALDFANCAKGTADGEPFCPNLARLAGHGVNYLAASTTTPSDSFPGTVGLITGGTPRTAGVYYDVSYDRQLSPPAQTTPYGLKGGAGLCPAQIGSVVAFDEEIDNDLTKLDGGGGINPNYLPRDPNNNCAPVYPHTFLRDNTIFEVVRANGGYTAFSDKHPAYDFFNGPSGTGVNDLYSPEINSKVVPLPGVAGCEAVADPSADLTAWTNSFANIKCYDSIKVGVILNEIDGKTHDGSASAPVPTLFGMNFQAVSVGEKLVENGVAGGYSDALGTPSASLRGEIQFVDRSVGKIVAELKRQGLYDSTLLVITAKHGQSPIDPKRVQRIPADNASGESPASLLGAQVAGSSEDDVSLLWLADQTQTSSAAATLNENEQTIGGGEIYSGRSLQLMFDDPLVDSRTPDIIVTPDVGVIYTGGKAKIAEHGGFAHDDVNVLMIVSNPGLPAKTVTQPVRTVQVAPTILKSLGLNPSSLRAVRIEGTQILPGLLF